jgi:hypothetical protein
LDGDLNRGIIVSEAPKSASGRPLKALLFVNATA